MITKAPELLTEKEIDRLAFEAALGNLTWAVKWPVIQQYFAEYTLSLAEFDTSTIGMAYCHSATIEQRYIGGKLSYCFPRPSFLNIRQFNLFQQELNHFLGVFRRNREGDYRTRAPQQKALFELNP